MFWPLGHEGACNQKLDILSDCLELQQNGASAGQRSPVNRAFDEAFYRLRGNI
jgi:hypothetical protein